MIKRTVKDIENVLLNSPASYRAWVSHGRPMRDVWLKLCEKWAKHWTLTGQLPEELTP